MRRLFSLLAGLGRKKPPPAPACPPHMPPALYQKLVALHAQRPDLHFLPGSGEYELTRDQLADRVTLLKSVGIRPSETLKALHAMDAVIEADRQNSARKPN